MIAPSSSPTAWKAGSATSFTPVRRAQVLLRLADQSFNYNYLGVRGFTAMATLTRQVVAYALEYNDLDDVLPKLKNRLEG